jgi:hypothetical protein
VLRTSAVGLVVACAFAGASVAVGQQGTTSYPEELWQAYPLEQRPATQAPPPASERRPSVATTEEDSSGSSLWWFVVAGAAAALVLVAVAADRQRRARSRRAESELLVPASWPAPPPARAPPRQARPARPTGPVCQVRWSRTGSFFFAVTTDSDGTERRIARSPRVDWNGSSPPEQEPEFEAALKVLSKQVRDLGWRPLRARGTDFDERRWYARRFRWPTEAEGDRPPGGDKPREVGEQVGTHTKRGDA